MADIVLFLIGLFPKGITPESVTKREFDAVLETGARFDCAPIGDVMAFTNSYHLDYEHLMPLSRNTSLLQLIDIFGRGIRRVVVVDGQGSVIDLISQSDMISLLCRCLPFLPK
jgi:hypothetical protein